MAVTFSDLHTEEGIKSLDQFLSGKTYISGDQLTKDDIKVYAAVVENPGDTFPNAAKWYDVVSSQLAPSFPGHAQGVRFSGAADPAEAAFAKVIDDLEMLQFVFSPEQRSGYTLKWIHDEIGRIMSIFIETYRLEAGLHAPPSMCQDDPQAATTDEDDDDLDLFGDETEEDKKAAEEREAAKKPAKKKESGKSSVLLDVKPWDDETDMKKLEETVRSIEMPGLLWGASKLVPVGYGIKKLQIMMTIVDDLVSVDTLVEERLTVEPCNEYIQSCDIVAFNKI